MSEKSANRRSDWSHSLPDVSHYRSRFSLEAHILKRSPHRPFAGGSAVTERHYHWFGFGSVCIDEDNCVFRNPAVWRKEPRFQSL